MRVEVEDQGPGTSLADQPRVWEKFFRGAGVAELNVARGSSASSAVQSAISSANSAITVTLSGGRIRLSSALSTSAASALESTIENFNSASDCG